MQLVLDNLFDTAEENIVISGTESQGNLYFSDNSRLSGGVRLSVFMNSGCAEQALGDNQPEGDDEMEDDDALQKLLSELDNIG